MVVLFVSVFRTISARNIFVYRASKKRIFGNLTETTLEMTGIDVVTVAFWRWRSIVSMEGYTWSSKWNRRRGVGIRLIGSFSI